MLDALEIGRSIDNGVVHEMAGHDCGNDLGIRIGRISGIGERGGRCHPDAGSERMSGLRPDRPASRRERHRRDRDDHESGELRHVTSLGRESGLIEVLE